MRRTVLLLVTMTTALVLASGVALAALSNTPDDSVEANGRVWDILRAGDKVYLAGSFTEITDKTGTTFARNNLAAIDAVTGSVTSWNPSATNPTNPGSSSVRAMSLSADGTRLFVGGGFTRVGGLVRGRLAAVDPITGEVDGAWTANADKPVYALTVSGSRLYLGGDFLTVAGQPRERLAAVGTVTGALDPSWKPSAHRADTNPKRAVRALDVSADGTRVYAGGLFNTISVNNVSTNTGKLAALTADTGDLVPRFKLGYPNDVLAMDVSGGSIYIGAADPLEGVESLDAGTGQLIWSIPGGHPDPEAGDVQAVAVSGDTVYAGGHFAQMGGLVRKRLFEADAATGQIGPWAPEIPGFQSGVLGVWALEVDPALGRVYAGGDFAQISGQDQLRFAQFSKQPDCTITGTSNNDVIEGTPGDDIICAGGGNDTIKGLGGNDILKGEGGIDQLYGGEGNDTLDGGAGIADYANFSGSSTAVNASLLDNTATGEGLDTLLGVENLVGSPNDDKLTGSDVKNTLNGGNGADVLDGREEADKLNGGGGNDILRGGSGNDSLVGSSGADDLFGDDDDDTLNSQDNVSGNDSLDGGGHINGDSCATDATEKSIINCEL